MKKLFLKSRFRAAWRCLTGQYFVAFSANDQGDVGASYNVTSNSIRVMAQVIAPAVEDMEGQHKAVKLAKDILAASL